MDPNVFWAAGVAFLVWLEYRARHAGDRLQFLTYWIRKLLPVPVRIGLWIVLGLHFIPLPVCDGYCL